MNKLLYILLFFALGLPTANCQVSKIDSLLTLLRTAKEDTNKVNLLLKLGDEYAGSKDFNKELTFSYDALALSKSLIIDKTKGWSKGAANAYRNISSAYFQQGKFDEALKNINNCVKIRELIGNKDELSKSYKNLALVYYYQGNYDKAIETFNSLLKIQKELGNKQGIASCLGNIGIMYSNQGNYVKALENYFSVIKTLESIGDKVGVATSYQNIGTVYFDQKNDEKALESWFSAKKIFEDLGNKRNIPDINANIGVIYAKQGKHDKVLELYLASLKIFEDLGDKQNIARSLGNLGVAYRDKGDKETALEKFFAAAKIQEEIGDEYALAGTYSNIGGIYSYQENYDKAFKYYFNALKLQEANDDKESSAYSYNFIGNLYLEQGNIKSAKKNLLLSLNVIKEIGSKNLLKSAYESLSQCDSAAGNFKGAYEYHKLFKEMNDSIFSVESAEKTAEMAAMYDGEKKETQIKLLEKDKEKQTALAVVEKKKQQTILYSVLGGLFLVLVFAGFMYNRFKVTQKQKHIITQQKHLVEEKHREITDSINYAERIQRSFLATTEMLDQHLKDYFVFFRPKDVVSGDFYWAGELNNGNFAFSVADSTGHGVPGAIMSILNISSLEKSIEKETEPDKILNQTRKIIIERLKKDGSTEGGKDGMDCSLLVINKDRTQLSFAAANNPVFIVRNNELMEFKPDKIPVGKHDNDTESFTLHTATLQKEDVIYALTDGFPDQFGGDKGKKYMIKNLKDLLLQIAHLPMLEQEQKLADEFTAWKGENEQVDDVCIIGVRI